MKIREASYKNVPAIKVETEKLEALFLPEYGGKCTSLKDKKNGREFLQQAPGAHYKKLAYDGNYVEAECSGFDDMFPTIDRCYYSRYPWQGIEIPDHGEVCALAWRYEAEKDRLCMRTQSPRFGYCLEKRISNRDDAISIDYQATNTTQFELDFVYAAHCMIAAEEGGKIILPGVKDGEKASLVFCSDKNRGKYGSPFIWKENERGAAVTPGPETKESYKFFFDEPRREGCCEYRYADGTLLVMSYSGDKLPYLGIWINWNDLHDFFNIAFEPSSGSFDRPDAARMRGQFSVLAPYGVYEWNITFALGS